MSADHVETREEGFFDFTRHRGENWHRLRPASSALYSESRDIHPEYSIRLLKQPYADEEVQPYHSWHVIHEPTKLVVGHVDLANYDYHKRRPGKKAQTLWSVNHSKVKSPYHRNIGELAYMSLVKRYGKLGSDSPGSVSTPAQRMWTRIGGRQIKQKGSYYPLFIRKWRHDDREFSAEYLIHPEYTLRLENTQPFNVSKHRALRSPNVRHLPEGIVMRDRWHVTHDPTKKIVGSFSVLQSKRVPRDDRPGASRMRPAQVRWAGVESPHHKNIGELAYRHLVKHYGCLTSDFKDEVSERAARCWQRMGATKGGPRAYYEYIKRWRPNVDREFSAFPGRSWSPSKRARVVGETARLRFHQGRYDARLVKTAIELHVKAARETTGEDRQYHRKEASLWKKVLVAPNDTVRSEVMSQFSAVVTPSLPERMRRAVKANIGTRVTGMPELSDNDEESDTTKIRRPKLTPRLINALRRSRGTAVPTYQQQYRTYASENSIPDHFQLTPSQHADHAVEWYRKAKAEKDPKKRREYAQHAKWHKDMATWNKDFAARKYQHYEGRDQYKWFRKRADNATNALIKNPKSEYATRIAMVAHDSAASYSPTPALTRKHTKIRDRLERHLAKLADRGTISDLPRYEPGEGEFAAYGTESGRNPQLQFDPKWHTDRAACYERHAQRYAKILGDDHPFTKRLLSLRDEHQGKGKQQFAASGLNWNETPNHPSGRTHYADTSHGTYSIHANDPLHVKKWGTHRVEYSNASGTSRQTIGHHNSIERAQQQARVHHSNMTGQSSFAATDLKNPLHRQEYNDMVKAGASHQQAMEAAGPNAKTIQDYIDSGLYSKKQVAFHVKRGYRAPKQKKLTASAMLPGLKSIRGIRWDGHGRQILNRR